MEIVNYISASAMPVVIILIIGYGVLEKNKVYDTFLNGAKEGLKIVIKLFPTLVGIFMAVGALRSSGILDVFIRLIEPVLRIFSIPIEIMPLAILRPISGSASMVIAIDIMSKYGVDDKIGLISSTIMGCTETTLYTIAIYTSTVGIKNIRFVLIASLIADFVGILTSIIIFSCF